MKKQLIGLTVLSSLVLGMTAAHAAPPTAELKVIGTLTVRTGQPDGRKLKITSSAGSVVALHRAKQV